MTSITFDDRHLHVTIPCTGRLAFLGRARQLLIPIEHVRSVEIIAEDRVPEVTRRFPGFVFPSPISSGPTVRNDRKRLIAVDRADKVIAIELEDEAYDVVIVDVDEPETVRSKIHRLMLSR